MPAYLPGRGIFESSLYLSWILKADTVERARHYYVWYLRQKREAASQAVPGTTAYTRLDAACKQMPELSGFLQSAAVVAQEANARKEISDIDSLLASTTYATINRDFDHVKSGQIDKQWYFLSSRRNSVHQLARLLNREVEYLQFYTLGSEIMHGSAIRAHMSVQIGQVTFEPLRMLTGIRNLCVLVHIFIIRIYRELLEKYRPGELERFNSVDARRWHDALTVIPEPTYNVEHQELA